jgi:cysteine desulfurase/selenocysteine lyase
MGTRDQALFACISAVIDYLSWLGEKVQTRFSDMISGYRGRARSLKTAMSWIEKYEQKLSRTMLERTDTVPGMLSLKDVEIYVLKDTSKTHLRTPTFSFDVRGVEPQKIVEYIWDKHGVVVLAEDFCSRALKAFGKSEAVRASLVHCNTVGEVETFLHGLADAVKHFKAT